MKWWDQMPLSSLFECWVLSQLFHSPFTSIKRLHSSSSLSVIRAVSSAYLMLLIVLPAVLVPTYALSCPALLMIYSAYKLNKQGNNIQPWHTPFPICNQSIVPCLVLTIASWSAYRFIRRQVRWYGIPIFWRIFHICCDPHSQRFSVINEAEVEVLLEFSCFFYDPMDIGNLTSGSSAFSISSLDIWKFSVHVLLKPSLENFKYYWYN